MGRTLTVEIVGDARSLERSFARAGKATKGFGREVDSANKHVSRSRSAFSGLGRIAGFAGASIGLAGLGGAVKAFVGEALDAQKVNAQTVAAIKSTGGAANVTAKRVDDLANSILKKTGIDDEAVKTSENMLLTFTRIRNETGRGNKIFDQATHSVADLATAMNQGAVPSADQMQKASLQLGKALNDPIKGIGSLSRVGIQFTKQQKDQIKTLVESGHTVQAQKIIIGELNKEVGGRAVAAGKTFEGQWKILKETVLNLGGAVAQQLMPAVQNLLGQLVKWLNNSKNQKQVLDTVKTACDAVTGVINVLIGALHALNTITGSTKNTLKLLFAVLVAYKGLQFAGKVSKMAESVGLLGARARGARGGILSMRGSLIGKAGLVAAVGIASYEITKMILHLTGLDKKLHSFGGKIADLVGAGGSMPSQPAPSQGAASFIRAQARRLRASGLSAAQTAARLTAMHPGVAPSDIRTLSGGIVINGGLHLHGVQDVKGLEEQLHKRAKTRPHKRRGN